MDRLFPFIARMLTVALLCAGIYTLISRGDRRDDTVVDHASWVFDVSNDDLLVGAADYVFFGDVLGMTPGPPLPIEMPSAPDPAELGDTDWAPTTAYLVRATVDVKGHLADTVGVDPNTVFVVIQQAGINGAGNLELFDGDSQLSAGNRYLLVVSALADDPYDACELATLVEVCASIFDPFDFCDDPGSLECAICRCDPLPPWAPAPLGPALLLFAPGFDHQLITDSAVELLMKERYETAYNNDVDPYSDIDY